MEDLRARWAELSVMHPAVGLYALVDGAQHLLYADRPFTLPGPGVSLFAQTDDEALADVGPWLVDLRHAHVNSLAQLTQLELAAPAVCGLLSDLDLSTLARALRERLALRLPTRREGLLRYWDPRVIVNLAHIMTSAQRASFFEPVREWYVLDEGQRVLIWSSHAQLQ